jgi:hypothetical protein
MNDYTFSSLTTVISGFNSAVAFQIQSLDSYVVEDSDGTISVGNLSNLQFTGTVPGFLTGRRPVSGQVFPRGVYNK